MGPDDGADSIIVSLTENVADKSVDMDLANALAADALAPAAKAPDDESAAEASEADMWITNCPADSPAVESTPENYRERDQSSADTEVGSGQDTPNGYCPHGDDSCHSNGGESNIRRRIRREVQASKVKGLGRGTPKFPCSPIHKRIPVEQRLDG